MKKLYRSTTDAKVCGVCGGIAHYLGIDSTVIRLVWLFGSVIFGAGLGGLVLYFVAAVLMPRQPSGADDDVVDAPYRMDDGDSWEN